MGDDKLSVWTLFAIVYFVAFGVIVVLGLSSRSRPTRRKRGRRQR